MEYDDYWRYKMNEDNFTVIENKNNLTKGVTYKEPSSLLATDYYTSYKSTLTSPAGDIVIYSRSYFNWIQRWFIQFLTGFKVEIKKD